MIAGVVAVTIFAASLTLILTERLHRTIAAMAGAAAMIAAGLALGFYSDEHAIAATDFHTLGLLLGMMLLVALLEPTGFFQYLAVWAARLSRGNPTRLLVLLGTVTTVLSMFLDNVTTVVLIAPVTILICEVLGVSAVPLLMAEALLSNTGGVATLIGDPPNVLIASAAGLSFEDFLTHSLPIVVVVWLAALGLLRYLFRKELAAWPRGAEAMLQLSPEQALDDPRTARKVLLVLAVALLAFLLQEALHIGPAAIALGAATAALVWVRPDLQDTLRRVEWSVLAFFVALFTMVGGLESAGVLRRLATLLAGTGDLPPVVLGVALLWAVALLSGVIDNVPITIAMIPVIEELGRAGVDPGPLWWALAFGAGFGGNATIIGSTANVVVVGLSERTRTPIRAALWHRRGLPVMLVTCAVASVLYVLAYLLIPGAFGS